MSRYQKVVPVQSCPWVGLTHRFCWVELGWFGSGWVKIFQFLCGLGWVHYSKSTKNWQDYFNAFKARLDKIWLHQAVEFDFVADLTGKLIRRSNKVIMLANDS